MKAKDLHELSKTCLFKKLHSKSKETSQGCWEYQGGIDRCGYGKLCVSNRRLGAHRVSYAIHKGDIPDGNVVMHLCNNPSCVNPEHLVLGTQKENVRQSVESGRIKKYGIAPSPRHKSRTSRGRVLIARNDEEMIVFYRSDLVDLKGFSRGPAIRCARGYRASYRGYQWSYA